MTSCNVCNRPLTDPASVRVGIGPVCFAKLRAKDDDNDSPDAAPKLPLDSKTMDIVCRREGGEKLFNVPHRVVHHSPSGMEWGYAGSGPADFALNVLLLFADEAWAGLHYQDFKRQFVATLPREGGVIRGAQIREWIGEQKRLAENLELEFRGRAG